MTERVARHETALRASGHSHPETYTYVDSATNVDMSSSRENAVRVEEIPAHDRCPVDGVGGQVVQTHYVFKPVPPAIQRPGKPNEHRTVWSEHNRHDIVSTDTLAELGLDVFTVSAEGGQMYLSPSGLDPRDERTRIRCVRVNGLQAVPGSEAGKRGATALGARHVRVSTRRPPGLTVPSAAPRSSAGRAPVVTAATAAADLEQHSEVELRSDNEVSNATTQVSNATTQVGEAGDQQQGEAGELDVNAAVELDLGPDADRVPRRQRRPTPHAEFRQRLGNAPHDETMHAAKRMGVRLVGADQHRGRLDRQRATANQTATAARKVKDPGMFPRAKLIVITDTVGAMPVSKLGNRCLQSWVIKGQPGHVVVTCAPDKSAASSWAGFETFARERGIELQRDATHQSVELVHDCGTECLGEFLAQCQRAGFVQRSATPHKKRKFEAHPSEGANRHLEAQMRVNLVGARRSFEHWGLDAREYWDRAVKYGARQIAVRTHCRTHDIAHDQMKRELLAPGFGASGMVKIQEGDTSHRQPGGKQLADRSVPGLFIGVTPNHKCITVLRDGSVMITSDVGFPVDEPETQLNAGADATPDDEWMAPIDVAFGTVRPPPAADTISKATATDGSNNSASNNKEESTIESHLTTPQNSVSSGEHADQPTAEGAAMPTASEAVRPPPAASPPSQATETDGPCQCAPNVDSTLAGRTTKFSSQPTASHKLCKVLQNNTEDSSVPANQNSAQPGATAAPPIAEAAVTPAAGAIPAPDAEPSFQDHEGKTVSIGDHIAVTADGEEQYGIVTDIDNTDHRTPGGEVRVDFADGVDDYEYYPLQPHRRTPMRKRFDAATHRALIGVWSKPICLRLTAATPPRAPHPSVLPCLDARGNILSQHLDGSATLPPAPPLPGPEARIVTPTSTADALAQPEAFFWLHSHVRELRGHLAPTNRPPTFHYTTERPRGRRLHIKFIYKVKRRQDNTIEKFKGRAVIAGWWLKRGVHYAESYTGQTPWSDVRDLESLACNMRLIVSETDLVQAFPFAGMPSAPNGEPVVAEMPASSKIFTEAGLEMFAHADQAWYGHPAAGNALAALLCRVLTGRDIKPGEERCSVRMEQHPSQPVVFVAKYPPGHKWHGEVFWLHVSTDNLRTYTSCAEMQHEFMEWCDRNFETTGGRVALQDQEPQTFNGVRFSYINGAVQLDMPAYIAKLLDEVGLSHANPALTPMALGTVMRLGEAPRTASAQLEVVADVNKAFNTRYVHYSEIVTFYSHLVSSIGWIASKVGPILLLPHSILCRMLSAPTTAAFTALKRVLRYLAGKQNMHITYVPDRVYDWRHGDYPVYEMQSDSSYADDRDDRKSQGGHTGGFQNQAITCAESRKGHRVATSTDQAEAQHAGSACKQAEYKRNFLGFLGVTMDQPTKLYVDNYATYLRNSCSVRKWSPASKQLDVLERYTVECVERKIVKLQHTPGHLPENPRPGAGFKVDALTKVLPTMATDFYHRELHGPDLLEAATGRG